MEDTKPRARFPWLSAVSIAGLCLPWAIYIAAGTLLAAKPKPLPGEGVEGLIIIACVCWVLGLFIGLLFALGAWNEKERWWKIAAKANAVYVAIAALLVCAALFARSA